MRPMTMLTFAATLTLDSNTHLIKKRIDINRRLARQNFYYIATDYLSSTSIDSMTTSCTGLSCAPTFVFAISSNVASPSIS